MGFSCDSLLPSFDILNRNFSLKKEVINYHQSKHKKKNLKAKLSILKTQLKIPNFALAGVTHPGCQGGGSPARFLVRTHAWVSVTSWGAFGRQLINVCQLRYIWERAN